MNFLDSLGGALATDLGQAGGSTLGGIQQQAQQGADQLALAFKTLIAEGAVIIVLGVLLIAVTRSHRRA